MFSAQLFLTKDWATSTHLGISLRNHWSTPKWLRNELCSLCWTVPSGHTPLSICLFGINCPWCALWRKADGVTEKNIWIYRLEGQTAYSPLNQSQMQARGTLDRSVRMGSTQEGSEKRTPGGSGCSHTMAAHRSWLQIASGDLEMLKGLLGKCKTIAEWFRRW